VEGALPHYQIVLTRQKGLDAIEVQVEVTAEVFSDRVRALEGLRGRLADALEQALGLRVAVVLAAPRSIQRSEGKAQRVMDRRNLA
jgi:phenylacetate-CoA ligase